MNLDFMAQIDAQLQKIGEKLEEDEDPAYIRTDCPACGTENKIHRMRARPGHAKCTECGAFLVIMMKRD